MKIAAITSLFPNSKEPNRGIFTLKLLERLNKEDIVVIAPIPWFPFITKNRIRNVPFKEEMSGITIFHPRFITVPFFLKSWDAFFFYRSIHKLRNEINDCDIIYSSYGYPDGAGAYYLARLLNKPFCITLHRGDLVHWLKRVLTKFQLTTMLKNSERVVVVSHMIKKLIPDWESNNRIVVIPNGVDINIFKPLNKHDARNRLGLGLDKKIFLTTGNSFKRKGYFELVEAFNKLDIDNKLLLIAGYDENEYDNLNTLIRSSPGRDSIILLGEVHNSQLPDYYSAADIYCLVSYSEGWPCSVMEALACAKPCIVTQEAAGEFITEDLGIVTNYQNLPGDLTRALNQDWNVEKILEFARNNSWDKAAQKMLDAFEQSIRTHCQ
ncbi:MAG: glycosyltransferase [Lentisphaerae bacterium]|nr:glycosyltransferase [Lentisphaerota bacterium]